ncbi:hypothetical protein T492DRAFT_1043233 [Pavlovales sp. CCMP2436]|nr:hypothetical protein T492DRAFT_1043233 [Pavlovales sp. CCMP2436]
MLACAPLCIGGRAQPGQWTVAVGSSLRAAVEVWTFGRRAGVQPLSAQRALALELPPRHSCHGLALGRAELLALASRLAGAPDTLFSAHFASRALQLHAYALDLAPMPAAPAAPADQVVARADGSSQQQLAAANGAAGDARAGRPAGSAARPPHASGEGLDAFAAAEAALARGCAPGRSVQPSEEEAMRALLARMRTLAAVYAVDWAEAPLLSVDEGSDGITFRVQLRKQPADEDQS